MAIDWIYQMKKNRDEILRYINDDLKDYEGYIQPMGKKIDEDCLFLDGKHAADLNKDEPILEAHFFSESKNTSISIRQINDCWLVSEVDLNKVAITDIDINIFYPKFGDFKIKMAQIWEDEIDELCGKIPVLKFKKAVFAGFVKDKKDEK